MHHLKTKMINWEPAELKGECSRYHMTHFHLFMQTARDLRMQMWRDCNQIGPARFLICMRTSLACKMISGHVLMLMKWFCYCLYGNKNNKLKIQIYSRSIQVHWVLEYSRGKLHEASFRRFMTYKTWNREKSKFLDDCTSVVYYNGSDVLAPRPRCCSRAV